MGVSNEAKLADANQLTSDLIDRLTTIHGKSPEYWMSILLKTRLYKGIYDTKTGLWGEGVMYVYDRFMDEIGGIK